MSFWGWFWTIGLLALLSWLFKFIYDWRSIKEKDINQHIMDSFGTTKEERRNGIQALFAKSAGALSMLIDIKKPYRIRTILERNLSTVEPIEKFALETAHHLYNEGFISDFSFFRMRLGLFYADGRGLDLPPKDLEGKPKKRFHPGPEIFNRSVTGYYGMNMTAAITHVLNRLEEAHNEHPDNLIINDLFQRYDQSQAAGGGQFNLEDYVTEDKSEENN